MPPKPDPKVSEPLTGYAEAVEQAVEARADPDVVASFEEFDELDEDAVQMEMEPPSRAVKQTAKRILTELTREFPRYYAVSPDEDGGIAIEAVGEAGRVLVICDKAGVACFTIINGKNVRIRYDHEASNDLLDDFIRSKMEKLK